ncbi:MAG: transcriptional regulator [Cellulosilyticum sp.]|nr:transcriptional regulator [Cellulosilyticum sp.]
MEGWVKLHRKLIKSDVFQNEKLLKVFVWCMIKATRHSKELVVGANKINLLPGQFVTGRRKAAIELCMKESTANNYLKRLEAMQMIHLNCNSRFTIVTIENYSFYQDDSKKDDRKLTEVEQKVDTNKKEKKEKNNNNVHFDAECEKIWSLYPNKKGKAQAIAKLPKLIEKYGYDAIENCVIAYANECKGKDIKYVKHGSTFFNGGYLDYLQIEAQEESSAPTKGPYIDEETGEIIRR